MNRRFHRACFSGAWSRTAGMQPMPHQNYSRLYLIAISSRPRRPPSRRHMQRAWFLPSRYRVGWTRTRSWQAKKDMASKKGLTTRPKCGILCMRSGGLPTRPLFCSETEVALCFARSHPFPSSPVGPEVRQSPPRWERLACRAEASFARQRPESPKALRLRR